MKRVVCLSIVLSSVGCGERGATESTGVAELGIAKLVVSDTLHDTTVVGLDASDHVVAKLALVHGRFTVTGPFRDDYDTPEVDGRKLDVQVAGQTLLWETAGYEPTLHMPAHPRGARPIAQFLAAREVKAVLDRWKIGFELDTLDDEDAYARNSFSGSDVNACDGQTTCGSVRGLTINTCGGGTATITASRATMPIPGVSDNQMKVAQCCPAGAAGNPLPWFATKSCPLTGTVSECGTATGACKGCASYDTIGGCQVTHDTSSVHYDYGKYTYLKASNTESYDIFGYSNAISGDGATVAIGAAWEDSAATGINGNQSDNSAATAGAVYVFSRSSGGVWSQQAYVKAPNTDADDNFGGVVALSNDGNTLVVGAAHESSAATGINGNQSDNSSTMSGAAYVYTRSGTTWTLQAYIKPSDTSTWAQFGSAIALSSDGNTLGVGEYRADNPGSDIGAVYVFTRSGTTWTQQSILKASNAGASDELGTTLSMSGDGNTIAVGALGEASSATGINGNGSDDSAPGSGAAYVFVRSGTTWSQQAYVKASNTESDDQFGFNVALSKDGNTLVVGARSEDSAAQGINGSQSDNSAAESGAAYVFTRSGTTWSQQAYIKSANSDAGDYFGWEAALSTNGNTMVIGARLEDSGSSGMFGNPSDNTIQDTGAVYRFTRSGTTWTQDGYIKASNPDWGDTFGCLAMTPAADVLVVAAPMESGGGTGVNANQNDNSVGGAGAVYIIE